VRDRDAALRVLAFRAGARFAVERLAVDFFAGARLADERLAVDLRAVVFFAVERFAVAFFAVERFAVAFFAVERFAVAFLAVVFLAVAFLAVALLAVALLAVALLAVALFAVAFLAVAFFAAAFFTPDFFAVAFLAVDFRDDPERVLELFVELRLDERDVDRAAAGTARAISDGSSISSVVSPMVDSPPHVSSAPTVGSLNEPAIGVSDASPVPLQSSSVM
jgi:hypothetical protein